MNAKRHICHRITHAERQRLHYTWLSREILLCKLEVVKKKVSTGFLKAAVALATLSVVIVASDAVNSFDNKQNDF